MIIGYVMGGQDNDSYLFDTDDPNLPICQGCGYITDFDYISPQFKLNRKIYDVSFTYDQRCIVSQRFKDFCIKFRYIGLEFRSLPNTSDFYYFVVHNIINVDADRMKLIYKKHCPVCGNYKSVTPGIPVYLQNIKTPLIDGFYATDIHTASGNEKSQNIIIAPETRDKLRTYRFRGIVFVKIES